MSRSDLAILIALSFLVMAMLMNWWSRDNQQQERIEQIQRDQKEDLTRHIKSLRVIDKIENRVSELETKYHSDRSYFYMMLQHILDWQKAKAPLIGEEPKWISNIERKKK